MAWVERRATRTSQPQDAVGIDQSKAKETGTVWAAVFSEKGTIRDQIGGARSTNPGGDGVSRGGKIATFNGSQQGVVPFSLPSGATFGKGLVIAARVRATAAQAGTPGCAFGLAASTGSQTSIGIGFDPSYNVGASWLTSSGAGITAYSPSAANAWVTVFVQCSNTNSGQVYYRSWINGIPATTNQGSSVAGTQGPIDELSIGAQHRSAGYLRQFKGDIEWAAVLNVPGAADFTLTDEAALNLYNSGYPYSLFEPEVIRIWVDDYVSAGGGATVIPIGVQATGSVGTPSATGAATTTPAGVSASSAVGTPIAVGGASIPATVLPAGVQATAAVGTVTARGAAVALPAGVTASVAVGTPVAIAGTSIPATVLPAGVQALGAVGTPAAQGAAIAQPLGVAATAYVGTPTITTGVSGVAVAYPAGVQAIGQVGTLIATGAAWTAAVGVQAVASVGTPTAYAGEIVIYVAGAQTRPSRLQTGTRASRLQTGTRASRLQTGTRASR